MDISRLLRFMHGLGVWLPMQQCPVYSEACNHKASPVCTGIYMYVNLQLVQGLKVPSSPFVYFSLRVQTLNATPKSTQLGLVQLHLLMRGHAKTQCMEPLKTCKTNNTILTMSRLHV